MEKKECEVIKIPVKYSYDIDELRQFVDKFGEEEAIKKLNDSFLNLRAAIAIVNRLKKK